MNARTTAAVWAGKAAGAGSRLLGRGGGTAIAGLVAERVDPGIVRRLASQAGAGAIAVTGTNGKTTTSLMLSRIAFAAGLAPLHNHSGSNLMRGVAAMLVEEASLSAAINGAGERLAILEVDEATLAEIVPAVQPRVIVFTNLFRDQLDRYGEVDTVAKSWERALASATPATTIVLNADDPAVAHLSGSAPGRVLYYGIDDARASIDYTEHASDFRMCLDCGHELLYDATFYGHLGRWRCSHCPNKRPAAQVRATRVVLGEDVVALMVALTDGETRIAVPLTGLYNAYNALAAFAASEALALPRSAAVRALESFSAAFGRQERFRIAGRDVQVLLGKNPVGLNEVLRVIAARDGRKNIVFFLNDGIADGRDVSWIWDADYELVRPQTDLAIAAGTRVEDLALRLKYAGFGDDVPIERGAGAAIRRALAATPADATLYVVPTYTAMLEVRELLARHGGAKHFWEGT